MFSQIPGSVLRKAQLPYPQFIAPTDVIERPSLESSTKVLRVSSDEESSNGEEVEYKPTIASLTEVTTSTTPTSGLMVEKQCQTTLTMKNIQALEADVAHLEAIIERLKTDIARLERLEESLLEGDRPFQPSYGFMCGNGRKPPLKIGLTLPKGIKRKVYYPSDEENE